MASNNSINNQALNGFTASGGTISLSVNANNQTILVGTGAAQKLVTVGSVNTTSSTTVQSGTGGINVVATNGSLTLTSGTGTLSIANDATNNSCNFGWWLVFYPI